MAIISGLYKLLDQQCTAPQIAELLERYKGINEKTKAEIRYSGNKPELLANLQRVVSLSLIPKQDVYALLQESEENGHQHIYYYRPNASARQLCGDPTEIATRLFDEAWGDEYFPQFERRSEAVRWADFRIGLSRKGSDWLGKLYGHERRMRIQGRRKEDVSATSFREIIEWEAEDYNTVLVVRWNTPGLLEVRIDQKGMGQAGTAEARLASVWSHLNDALDRGDFVAWDLRNAMTKLLEERKASSEVYDLGTVRLIDGGHGGVQFDPYAEQAIDNDKGRTRAMDELLKNNAKGTRLGITWKPVESVESFTSPLLTTVTGDEFNCLSVSAQTSAEVIDYVTNKLRQFAS